MEFLTSIILDSDIFRTTVLDPGKAEKLTSEIARELPSLRLPSD